MRDLTPYDTPSPHLVRYWPPFDPRDHYSPEAILWSDHDSPVPIAVVIDTPCHIRTMAHDHAWQHVRPATPEEADPASAWQREYRAYRERCQAAAHPR